MQHIFVSYISYWVHTSKKTTSKNICFKIKRINSKNHGKLNQIIKFFVADKLKRGQSRASNRGYTWSKFKPQLICRSIDNIMFTKSLINQKRLDTFVSQLNRWAVRNLKNLAENNPQGSWIKDNPLFYRSK